MEILSDFISSKLQKNMKNNKKKFDKLRYKLENKFNNSFINICMDKIDMYSDYSLCSHDSLMMNILSNLEEYVRVISKMNNVNKKLENKLGIVCNLESSFSLK